MLNVTFSRVSRQEFKKKRHNHFTSLLHPKVVCFVSRYIIPQHLFKNKNCKLITRYLIISFNAHKMEGEKKALFFFFFTHRNGVGKMECIVLCAAARCRPGSSAGACDPTLCPRHLGGLPRWSPPAAIPGNGISWCTKESHTACPEYLMKKRNLKCESG